VAFIAVAVAGAAWFWNQHSEPPDAELVPVPLTSYPGTEDAPSFSPDGTQVAFTWYPEATPWSNGDIYIKQIGVERPFRLTDNPANEYSPVWSPDGQTIAFLRDVSPKRVALVLIPHRQGPERVLAEFAEFNPKGLAGPFLAWTPDSKSLVATGLEGSHPAPSLLLVSVETGEKRRLTTPPVTDGFRDTCPAVSPNGRTLAFIRVAIDRDDLYLLRLAEGYMPQGEPERIAVGNLYVLGAAWTPDGSEIILASGNGSNSGLWRTAASKSAKPRRLAFASDQTFAPAVSRQGNRLAYVVASFDSNIWRVELHGPGRKPGIPVRIISSTQYEAHPAYSADGKRIAFASWRSGAGEIWVCESDGSNPVKLTSSGGTGPRWSPDGQSIAFRGFQPGNNEDIHVVDLKGGPPRRLTTHPATDKWPYWSRDGQWLYFCSMRTGEPGQIWKIRASAGEEVQITRNGGDFPQESPNGKFVYYEKGWPSQCSVWKIPVEGGEETKVLDSVHPHGKWAVGIEGIYFFAPADEQRHTEMRLYEFATGKTRKILTIESALDQHIAISPDGRTILYTQIDEGGSDLMLVENFR
jgi:Tol biopolymer transport system component